MRIVLDTNLVMSALLWRGTPYRLLDAIRQRSNTQLYSSATLLEELADVLTRPIRHQAPRAHREDSSHGARRLHRGH